MLRRIDTLRLFGDDGLLSGVSEQRLLLAELGPSRVSFGYQRFFTQYSPDFRYPVGHADPCRVIAEGAFSGFASQ